MMIREPYVAALFKQKTKKHHLSRSERDRVEPSELVYVYSFVLFLFPLRSAGKTSIRYPLHGASLLDISCGDTCSRMVKQASAAMCKNRPELNRRAPGRDRRREARHTPFSAAFPSPWPQRTRR